jgi:hypothetical protein
LLGIRALLLSVGSQAQRVQPSVHLFHCPSEIRQLRGNARDVFSGGQSSPILGLIPDRDGLDLDQDVVTEEPAHLDECARRRLFRVDVLVADRPHGPDLADVS